MKSSRVTSVALVATLVLAFGISPLDAQEANVEIEELGREYVERFNAGEERRVSALFAEDVLYFDAFAQTHEGRDAVEALYRELLDAGFDDVQVEAIETEVFNDRAYQLGSYIFSGDEVDPLEGYYVVILQRTDGGEWQFERVIANLSIQDQPVQN